MPKVEATVDVLVDIANYIYMGALKNLHIRRYKTGMNAGKLFAEYSLKEESAEFNQVNMQERGLVSNLVKKAAMHLSNKAYIDLYVYKRHPYQEKYNYRLSVKESIHVGN